MNHEGSSSSMESKLAVQLVNKTWNQSKNKVYIGCLVSDDDTTMRANCQNITKGGYLNNDVPTPTFLADPTHRIKCMVRPVQK